jgi:beta-lactamase regulating signal transducer with metallopeptidase domain
MLPVMLDSAVRSLLLGFVVWVLLKVARLRDTSTETAIWTAVLIAALSMPLLSGHVPGLVLPVPHLPAAAAAAGPAAATPAAATATALELLHGPQMSPPDAGISTWPALPWLAHHGRTCLMAAYLLGFSVCGIRLAMGLLLTVRLYRRATPVQAAWVQARNIRATAEIRSPVSLAGAILLPADYGEWSAAKRSAVLAHEEAHIARGDFFVQMAALIHCAFFWFSPFAWWLQTKLAEIAETASDEAAIRRLNDRATYAEILVEVSRRAQKSPLIVAMAKSSFIQQRVEHILSEAPTQSLSLPQRVFSVALLAALAIAVAGAKTADPVAVTPPAAAATAAKSPAAPASRKRGMDSTPAHIVRAAHVVHEPREASSTAEDPDDHTYNPRALLDPVYTPKPNYVPAATVVHAGREFYIRSTEKPVADVSVTYAMQRQIH